ncbi:MAG: general secretion pathway protein GspB [Gammaproteobacteria bacterium]|nr:general secretion pathway protein GspB [Gammaproteobacteria bacterium]
MCRRSCFAFAVLALWSLVQVGGATVSEESAGAAVVRDPTRPPGARVRGPVVQTSTTVPELSSVLIGADRRLAVIDGKVMAEGESRAGVKVWQIKADRVVVSIAGSKPVTLMLDKARIHKEIR